MKKIPKYDMTVDISLEELKEAITDGLRYMDSQYRETEHGIKWERSDDDNLSADRNYANPNSFHAGNAGMIPFLLQEYEYLNDERYLELAEQTADTLLYSDDIHRSLDLENPTDDSPFNIYGEIPGEAAAMYRLYEYTGDERYLDFAKEAFQCVGSSVIRTKNGFRWGGRPCYAMAGDAGTLLYLIDAARKLNDHKYDEVIRGVSYELLSLHEEDEAGYYWKALHPLDREDYDVYWPGLEFGTSGVAQALAEAGQYLGDPVLLEGAEKGAEHLMKIAKKTEPSGVLFPMNSVNPNIHYLGHCYGSMGIMKFSYSLYAKTGKQTYRSFLEQIDEGIRSTGAPLLNSAGYWKNDCYCCGVAGLLSMYLGLYAAFREKRYLDGAKQSAVKLISDSFRDDGKGLRWYQAYTRLRPYDHHCFNGYILGNAGNLTMLTELALLLEGRYRAFRFVEDPFPDRIID